MIIRHLCLALRQLLRINGDKCYVECEKVRGKLQPLNGIESFLEKDEGIATYDLKPVRYKRHAAKPLEKKVLEPRSSEVEKVYSQHAILATLFSRIACDSSKR